MIYCQWPLKQNNNVVLWLFRVIIIIFVLLSPENISWFIFDKPDGKVRLLFSNLSQMAVKQP